jgi:hypothetical protein
MKASTYEVTETRDLDLAMQLYRRIRGGDTERERFEWLYAKNPAGAARIWILTAPSGDSVGFTSGYPREVWVDGKECRALNCGDFSVEVGHRTLGPAVKLRLPAKEAVDAGEYAFLYAHPVPAMLAVHKRTGHRQLSDIRRWVYPLRAQGLLARKFGKAAARVVGPVANLALRARHIARQVRSRRVEVAEVDSIGSEYDELDRRLGQSYRVIVRRTEAYLNWRCFERPDFNAKILEARNTSGTLLGYLVLRLMNPATKVHDLAYLPEENAGPELLLAAARLADKFGSQALDVMVQNHFPRSEDLRRLGFWERVENHPTVCHAGAGFWGKAAVENAENWYMTLGDRDV